MVLVSPDLMVSSSRLVFMARCGNTLHSSKKLSHYGLKQPIALCNPYRCPVFCHDGVAQTHEDEEEVLIIIIQNA